MLFVFVSVGGGLSLPLRRGGGAFGGSFFVVVGLGAAVESVGVATRLLAFTHGIGVPCLCFGTSGRGFFLLPPLLLAVMVDCVGLLPPTPGLGVVNKEPPSLLSTLPLSRPLSHSEL